MVLKPHPPGDSFTFDRVVNALHLAATLRQRGYPIPRHEAVLAGVGGLTVSVQALAPGTVPNEIDSPIAVQLVELMKLQADIGQTDGLWSRELIDRVRTTNGPGREALESAHPELRSLLAETREVSETTRQTLRSTDAVHTDLHGENVMVDDGKLSAVVDWEGARVGDWRWDLAMLAWYHNSSGHPVTPEAAEVLRQALSSVTDRSALAFLAAAAAHTRLLTTLLWRGSETLSRDLEVTRQWVRPSWS